MDKKIHTNAIRIPLRVILRLREIGNQTIMGSLNYLGINQGDGETIEPPIDRESWLRFSGVYNQEKISNAA